MHYEQTVGSGSFIVENNIGVFDRITPDLAFNDSILEPVKRAWQMVIGEANEDEYMQFDDREGVNDDDDPFNS